ncbi:MAG: DUF2490 domain-containing protein [Candidatus Omnitrophica bacterium]|nr:DUF2490 domain-containing protein [Candidatus Omnitrophota bacterium]
MPRKEIILIIIFILSSYLYAFDNDDFQFWYTQSEEFKFSKNSKISLEEELRFGDNTDHLYYHHHDLGILFNLNDSNFGFGYRHIYEEKKAKFKIENEPYVIYAYKGKIGIFNFNHRLRLEYRHFDYQPDCWRLRDKLDLILLTKFGKLKIQPYFSDEVFLNFQNKSFSQNRLYLGLLRNLNKNLKIDFYYLLQHTISKEKWKKINVLGTKIKLIF